jgi:hypothetical protein
MPTPPARPTLHPVDVTEAVRQLIAGEVSVEHLIVVDSRFRVPVRNGEAIRDVPTNVPAVNAA